MRLLVVNPNTTASMTGKIGDAAARAASPGTEIVAVNPGDRPGQHRGLLRRGDLASPACSR